MGTQSLQSLCTFVMVAGFILTGLGGLGSFYFGRVTRNDADLQRAAKEHTLTAKVEALQKSNDDLRRQVELFETMPASTGVARTTSTPVSQTPQHSPEATPGLRAAIRPNPVKMSAPPLASPADWTEGPTLEQMVAQASSPAPVRSAGLNERQRQEMSKVLRKHTGKAIAIHSVAGDSGGLEFAEALRREFLDAGWHVGNVNQIPYAKPPVGLYVSAETFPSPEEVIATYQALTAAGLNVSQQLDPKLNGGKAVLLVGASLK